jgi:CRP-like cAMP-binding protein
MRIVETHTLEKLVREHPFLEGLPDHHVSVMQSCARNMRFAPGEFVLREGEPADSLFLIRAGRVAIEAHAPDRGAICVGTVGEGEALGWSWIVPPYRWHFDARATEITRALALDGACLRKQFEGDHDLGYGILKRFVEVIEKRLTWTRMQLLDLYQGS